MPRAVSKIGRLACRVNLRQEDILVAYRAYVDSSGKSDDEFMTVAIFAGSDEMWAEFESGWQDILNANKPKASYIHMREILNQDSEEFNYRNGWSLKTVFPLIWKCLVHLSRVDKNKIQMFHCVIDLKARDRLLEEGYLIPSPAQICSDFTARNVLRWHSGKKETFSLSTEQSEDGNEDSDSFHFFFDMEEECEKIFREEWNLGWADAKRTRKFNPWVMIDAVSSANSRKVPGLQAADLRAWSVNRRKTSDEGMPGYAFSEIMDNIIPSGFLELDEIRLREIYGKILIPKFRIDG
jgi:uncharacterized protein DUF3800